MQTATPEQLEMLILAMLGASLQLLFLYGGKFADWYQGHEKKGLLALGFSFLAGMMYFAISCTPYVAKLPLALSCNSDGFIVLLIAVYRIAIAQTAAFVILPKYKKVDYPPRLE